MSTSHEIEDSLKLFHISNQMLEDSLDQVEARYAVNLGRNNSKGPALEDGFYSQIDASIRAEARNMASMYEVFYSLEKTIRNFIEDSFVASGIIDWWNEASISQKLKEEIESRMNRELDAGVTPRSSDPIDYSTFGELSEIIKSNWDVFSGTLQSKRAVEVVFSRLNTLRGPIAHCSPLAEDEVLRLKLSVRDWFRLMS